MGNWRSNWIGSNCVSVHVCTCDLLGRGKSRSESLQQICTCGLNLPPPVSCPPSPMACLGFSLDVNKYPGRWGSCCPACNCPWKGLLPIHWRARNMFAQFVCIHHVEFAITCRIAWFLDDCLLQVGAFAQLVVARGRGYCPSEGSFATCLRNRLESMFRFAIFVDLLFSVDDICGK